MKQKAKSTLPTATNLIITVSIIIIGVVFRRSYQTPGYWISIAALCWYCITSIPGVIKSISGFPSLPGRHKAHALIVGTILGMLIWLLCTASDVNYFIVIVLLAVDYLLLEENGKEKSNVD